MKLYIYDHCPYCVKARMIFGLKKIIFELICLQNDDEDTPKSMIGQKMVPILRKEDGTYMPESLDIINYVDQNYGNWPIISKIVPPSDYYEAFDEFKKNINLLTMPRWAKSELDEFKTESARNYFIQKKEAYIGSFQQHLKNSTALIADIEQKLINMEKFVMSERSLHGRLTIDDFHFFAALRSLSIVKGIKYPEKIDAYRKSMSHSVRRPLHDDIAI